MKLFINYAAYRIEGFLLKFVSIRKAGGAAVGIVILTNLNIFLSILIILYRVFKIDFEKMFKFQWSEIALPFAIIITLFQMYLLFFNKRLEKSKNLFSNESLIKSRIKLIFVILYLLCNPAFFIIALYL